MAKQWWQSKNEPIKPWVIRTGRDSCGDSQWVKLQVSGLSEKQGPTHFCPICRWGFWPVKFIPNTAQVKHAMLTNPKATTQNMSYIRMCNKPKPPYNQSVEYAMIIQLGKCGPSFLTEKLKEYWLDKYCTKFPSTERAIQRKKYKQQQIDLYTI
jgi:hypothetical protein